MAAESMLFFVVVQVRKHMGGVYTVSVNIVASIQTTQTNPNPTLHQPPTLNLGQGLQVAPEPTPELASRYAHLAADASRCWPMQYIH